MKKNKNKMIGMSTGFTLRSMKDLYCNNSIIKTGIMVAGVMLASCGNGNDNNNNNDDEKNKENNLQVNTLKDDVKKTLAKELKADVNDVDGLQKKIDECKLTKDDINEDGTLKDSGKAKIETKEKMSAPDPNDKTIVVNKLDPKVKENLAGDLEVKDDKDLESRIAELNLNTDDIDENGKLNESGKLKKTNAENDKMAKALDFLEDKKEDFINYLNDLDHYFGNKKGQFAKDIKDKKEEEIKQLVIDLCNNYAPYKKDKDNGAMHFQNITAGFKNNKYQFIESKIKESIEDEADFNKVNYTCAKKDDSTIKVTVKKATKQVDFDLSVTTDELFSLKTTAKDKDGNDVEIKLYRITISIADDDAKKDELTKLLVPKKPEDIKTEAEAKIEEVLEASIKTVDNKIDVSDFKKLADTLKKLVEATQKLLNGQYNDGNADKFLADVKDLNVLHQAFGKAEYANAIKTVLDDKLKAIKDVLEKVSGGELDENIIMSTPALDLNANDQKIESHTIHEVISALLTYNSNDTDNNSKSVIKNYIVGCTNAKIEVKNDGEANLELEFVNGEKINKQGIVAFAEQNTVGGDQIININKAFETALKHKIGTLNFGIVNSQKTCKDQISNGYIDNILKFENLTKIIPADIEKGLRTACGKDKTVITTVDDVKNHIVLPVMKEVFGNDTLVKAVFTEVNKLFNVKVGQNKKLMEEGITSIYQDNQGEEEATKVTNTSKANEEFGTATRLKIALLDIRKAIENYNNSVKSAPNAVKNFFEFYFGKVGTGKIDDMYGGENVPTDLEWMRLGKAVAKWVFSKSTSKIEQEMRKDYDAASKALAMSILLQGATVQDYNNVNTQSNVLWWFASGTDDQHLDLTNNGDKAGLGGSDLTNSTTQDVDKIKVDFNNMIICNKLKTKTSNAEKDPKEIIVVPVLKGDTWKGTQIVVKQFGNNFGDKGVIKSDFALLALFLGYFQKSTGDMITIAAKGGVTPKVNDDITGSLDADKN